MSNQNHGVKICRIHLSCKQPCGSPEGKGAFECPYCDELIIDPTIDIRWATFVDGEIIFLQEKYLP